MKESAWDGASSRSARSQLLHSSLTTPHCSVGTGPGGASLRLRPINERRVATRARGPSHSHQLPLRGVNVCVLSEVFSQFSHSGPTILSQGRGWPEVVYTRSAFPINQSQVEDTDYNPPGTGANSKVDPVKHPQTDTQPQSHPLRA